MGVSGVLMCVCRRWSRAPFRGGGVPRLPPGCLCRLGLCVAVAGAVAGVAGAGFFFIVVAVLETLKNVSV